MKSTSLKYCLLCFFLISQIITVAQTPTIRKIEPIRQTPAINNPNVNRQVIADTAPTRRLPGLIRVPKKDLSIGKVEGFKKKNLLFQLEEEIYGKEFAYKNIFKAVAKYGTEKWAYKIAWWNANAAVQYGRVEISTLPFPPFETKDFSGIVQSYIIKAPQKDSAVYDIVYSSIIENKNEPLATINLPNGVKIKPIIVQSNKSVEITQANKGISEITINEISKLKLTDIKTQPNRISAVNAFSNNYALLKNSNNLTKTEGGTTFYLNNQLLSALANFNVNDITYYIRIVPLGGRQSPVDVPTNTILVKWDEILWGYSHPKPPCTPVNHESDYTITNIEYTPAHFPERNCTYSNDAENIDCKNCVIVSTIKDAKTNEQFKGWGIGVNIGDKICPAKKKESWYEKVIGSSTKFAKDMVNGASKLYNDAKNYAKDNVKKAGGGLCGDPCAAISGYAFDAAMMYCGIPPSIPNMDELTDKGLDYAVELAAEQAGVPCDDICKDLVKKGLKDAVKQSTESNFVDAGWYTVKPDPRGYYRNAYVTITIKKTGNSTYKNKYACGEKELDLLIDNYSKYNLTPNENISGFFVAGTTTNQSVFNGSLFNYTKIPLPFNAETPVGTEVKIIRVLQPQLVYIKNDDANPKKIESISNDLPAGGYNKQEQEHLFLYNYEYRPQHYNVWRVAYKNAPVQFKFNYGNIKIADGVNNTFINPAFVSDVSWDDILD